MRALFYLISFLFFLSSCTTSSVVVSMQRPADITLSQEIKSVVVANRTTPSKKNLAGNIIEGLVSGEGIGTDKRGSEYCLDGLVNLLINNLNNNKDSFISTRFEDKLIQLIDYELILLILLILISFEWFLRKYNGLI